MIAANEIVIRIKADGSVCVEEYKDGIKSFKAITPNSLIACIDKSMLRGGVSSGLLPRGCLSFKANDDGSQVITMLHESDKADISYVGTMYKDFPLPRLVFGFNISEEGKVSNCKLGIVDNSTILSPATPMFAYPFSNVSGTNLCVGNNRFPQVKSLHTLGSMTYFILSMDNNNDMFKPSNNKLGLEMRDLLELLKDKPSSYYYEHILLPSGKTLGDFIA